MEDNDSWDSLSEFTLAEVLEMENSYKAKGDETLNEEFCKKLATNFSSSSNRLGKSTVTWQQVQHFFQEKQMEKQNEQDPSAMALDLFVDLSDANSSKPLEIMHQRKGTAEDLKELSFEARSSKDYAWYDVETFLNYRVLYNGELKLQNVIWLRLETSCCATWIESIFNYTVTPMLWIFKGSRMMLKAVHAYSWSAMTMTTLRKMFLWRGYVAGLLLKSSSGADTKMKSTVSKSLFAFSQTRAGRGFHLMFLCSVHKTLLIEGSVAVLGSILVMIKIYDLSLP
ncbi:hypothetical protein V6N11_048813 [Hibiscus sabdariffa]|uniref:SAWADEE domain-containing protein n=1 Tax=Hibiscus sabdariffa TaxID=183260 RepID=A0ABR2PWD8_9ROSI